MNPVVRPLRAPARPICRLCDYALQQSPSRRSFLTATALKAPTHRRPTPRQRVQFPATTRRRYAEITQVQEMEPEIERPDLAGVSALSLRERTEQVERAIQAIINSDKVEPEEVTIAALNEIEAITRGAIALRAGLRRTPATKLNLRHSSASAILSLDTDDTPPEPAPARQEKSIRDQIAELPTPSHLSRLAEELILDPIVYISNAVLDKYVDVQKLLNRPRPIAEALYLFAHKPVPEVGSSPPRYKDKNPKSFKSHIPGAIAAKALDAAITAKDMECALTCIDHTYAAPAYMRWKWLSKAGPPFLGACSIPYVAYFIADSWKEYGGYIDEQSFKWRFFAGFMAYFYATGTLGFVALTTWSTHHVRVVWRPGQPLLMRWLREDERAALDKIAIAWGFTEDEKKGDEQGEEWDGLRQWCALRGMWLDKPELLPGMTAPTVSSGEL
ncbi:hypothetical protein M011DRAFT_471681 [Sporormia fimetaria CBS 119925]|uniref:Uncharacterized protein n=1 Tax=Sporormia fimetaria CBS 119925 TaxID=1340428 RepID=A0A6A6V082_9PLEO|nr:hypothetical protein M011DRAFT_471681 [Sporormia fimetaria CBS 119925]